MDRIYKIEGTYYSEYMGPEFLTVYVEARDEDEAHQIFGDHFPMDDDGHCGNYEIDDLREFERVCVPSDIRPGYDFFTRETPEQGWL